MALRVLVACEESQEVTKAFRALGHEAYSCDLQECSGGHPEWHFRGNIDKWLWDSSWDLVIAHPPCTRLANSGVRWLAERGLWSDLDKATRFFNKFRGYHDAFRKPVAIENPIPHKYATAKIGFYSQLIHPWQFGHPESKATCLWLFGVPPLMPNDVVDGRDQRVYKMSPSVDRAKLRSKTFPGIARAMAEQWGKDINTRALSYNGNTHHRSV